MLARRGIRPLVTDRRILQATRLYCEPRRGEWVCEALPFDQITRWTLGRLHDHRPLMRLEHAPIARMEHVPKHRFLRFTWGDAEGAVLHWATDLAFGKDRDLILEAISKRLEELGIPKGKPFEIRPPGTREERLDPKQYFTSDRP